MAQVRRSEGNSVQFVFSFYLHMDSGDQTQVIRFASSGSKLLLIPTPQVKAKFEASFIKCWPGGWALARFVSGFPEDGPESSIAAA